MNKNSFGVFFIALASLLLEIILIRVFDVLWYPNMAYMIITMAVFSFGLAGVYLCVFPVKNRENIWKWLALSTFLMSIVALFLFPAINNLPFDYTELSNPASDQSLVNFFLIYGLICLPFFLAGFTLSLVFSSYAEQIRRLYFYDLVGAALGVIIILPLLPKIGTVGIIYVVAGFSLLATACFSKSKVLSGLTIAAAIAVSVLPFTWDTLEVFEPHMDKRGYRSLGGIKQGTWWDPISKIDIINYEALGQLTGKNYTFKWIAYDGGTQTSYFYRFDGDFVKLREELPHNAVNHFWQSYLAVSHYFKADSDSEVLVIGSAGGQEAKAALTYNAKHVDGIELVGKVVELGKTEYADYIGNIMNHPNVDIRKGEGRSFLRSQDKKYDIIQINSNHTSSSIAAGSGAMSSVYLQTVEAYEEYFSHLNEDGILHINHHVYQKMVATAAQAWANLGLKDFQRHVIVYEDKRKNAQDNLPTFLVKMTPWTQADVQKISDFLLENKLVVDPLNPDDSFLTHEFFEPNFPQALADKIPYRIIPPTDNKPFFNSLRKDLNILPVSDKETFVNPSVAGLLNSQYSTILPTDVLHLVVTGGSALLFALVFTLIPLMFSKAGREKWDGKSNVLGYFACLGAGFIILELIFIQIFMKLIGYPLYAYTTVLFTFLFGAGIGSFYSEKLEVMQKGRWGIPFIGIIISTLLLVFCKQVLFDYFLQFDTLYRVIISFLMIFPLAFFLGMPFPQGILALKNKPHGTVAWAWAFNGLFTVVGGIIGVILSVYFGFQFAMIFALALYVLAFYIFSKLYSAYNKESAAV